MRVTPLAPAKEYVSGLAKVWLASGASSFALAGPTGVHAAWEEGDSAVDPLLSAPIVLDGETIGELRVRGVAGKLSQMRLDTDAELVAQILALHRDLQRARQELNDSHDELAMLYALSQQSRSTPDPQDILQALAREAVERLDIEGAFALLTPPIGPRMLVQEPEPILDTELVAAFFEHSQLSGEEVSLSREEAQRILSADIDSLLFVPITVGETVMGGLGLINKSGRDFNDHDHRLMRTIADSAGSQIENFILQEERLGQAKIQTELELARRVQLDLLPEFPPEVQTLDIFGRSRPALHVGGDFFDYVTRPDTPFICVVGDVSGKGLAAAILMAMTRRAMRSAARFLPQASPDRLFSRALEDLYDDFIDVEMFCTLFLGLYDPATRTLTYSNAGHSPIIYVPVGGQARLLEADGPPLGLMPVNLSEVRQVILNKGDVLLIGSDGFTEARNDAEELFGFERLLRLAETHAQRSAEELGETFFSAITEFSLGMPQNDDQTLVILKGQ